MKRLELEELIPTLVYCYKNAWNTWFFILDKVEDGRIVSQYMINMLNETSPIYGSIRPSYDFTEGYLLTEADPLQREWFLECVAKNQFIKSDERLKDLI